MDGLSSFGHNVVRRACLGDMLTRTTARTPNRQAFVFRDKSFTYQEFNAAVNRCCDGLKALGLSKGDRAAIMSHNCDAFIIYWWALLKLGAIITPLNFMLKGEEIRYIINHSEPKVFFVEDTLIANVLPVIPALKGVETYGYINLSGGDVPEDWMNIEHLWHTGRPASEPEVVIEAYDPALLLYTSGTESLPKGVLNSHLNFYMDVMSALCDLGVRPVDRLIGGIPLYHVAAMYLFVTSVALGATTVLEYAPNPQEILELTQGEQLTFWVWPPALYAALPFMPDFETYDLTSLKTCIIFGSLAPPAVIEKWKGLLPQAGFMNYYGQTEMSPLGTTLLPADFDARPDSIGRAHLPLELRVFGIDENEVPRGEVGELVARGPSIMLGYYKDPQKTAQTFRGGWHRPGDLVRMDDQGYVYFVDRRKDVIKSGGENVSSQEVEAMLFKCPGVADAAVIGLPDPYWSEVVTAVVVPAPGQRLTAEQVIAFCRKELAGYKVPKKVMVTDTLPRNPSGKILKNVLRERFTPQEVEASS